MLKVYIPESLLRIETVVLEPIVKISRCVANVSTSNVDSTFSNIVRRLKIEKFYFKNEILLFVDRFNKDESSLFLSNDLFRTLTFGRRNL